jgi:hypothetical protein
VRSTINDPPRTRADERRGETSVVWRELRQHFGELCILQRWLGAHFSLLLEMTLTFMAPVALLRCCCSFCCTSQHLSLCPGRLRPSEPCLRVALFQSVSNVFEKLELCGTKLANVHLMRATPVGPKTHGRGKVGVVVVTRVLLHARTLQRHFVNATLTEFTVQCCTW